MSLFIKIGENVGNKSERILCDENNYISATFLVGIGNDLRVTPRKLFIFLPWNYVGIKRDRVSVV